MNLQQCLICIYAPADAKNRHIFFEVMSTFLISGKILLRDFNSMTDPSDRLSGNLDGTSHMLDVILLNHNFVEIDGSHRGTFSYFHPSISSRKSQIDRIYINFHNPCLQGYSSFIYISDHYLIRMFSVSPDASGPQLW